jgi:autotransporter passenger strand-loop-strand repeat protein
MAFILGVGGYLDESIYDDEIILLSYTGSITTFPTGMDIGTTVNNSGSQYVDGGTAIDTTVNDGGYQEVGEQYPEIGGTAISTTVNSLGRQVVLSGVQPSARRSTAGATRMLPQAVQPSARPSTAGATRMLPQAA